MLGNRSVAKSIVAFGLLLVPGIEAEAAQAIILPPYSPWNVDYGEKVCSLRRGFGTKEKLSVLIMHRFGPTDHFALTVVSDEFSRSTRETTWSCISAKASRAASPRSFPDKRARELQPSSSPIPLLPNSQRKKRTRPSV